MQLTPGVYQVHTCTVVQYSSLVLVGVCLTDAKSWHNQIFVTVGHRRVCAVRMYSSMYKAVLPIRYKRTYGKNTMPTRKTLF